MSRRGRSLQLMLTFTLQEAAWMGPDLFVLERGSWILRNMTCVAPTVDGSHTQLSISKAVCFYLLIYFNQHFFCNYDFSNTGGGGEVHASSILLLLKASSHFHPFPPSPTPDSSLYHCSHKSHNAPVIITPTPVYLKPVAWRGASLSLSLCLPLSLFPPPLPCCSFSHYLSFLSFSSFSTWNFSFSPINPRVSLLSLVFLWSLLFVWEAVDTRLNIASLQSCRV